MSVDRGHYSMVAGAILDGKVVPVLGAGANLCDREENETWKRGVTLPSGAELAEAMGTRIGTTEKDEDGRTIKAEYDLIRVSQAVLLGLGEPNLYAMLRKVFVRGDEHNVYEPTSLHRFLAGLPDLRAHRGLEAAPLLIVSTNYDDLLEQAFTDAGKRFDLVYYLAQGDPAPVGEAALEPGKRRRGARARRPNSVRCPQAPRQVRARRPRRQPGRHHESEEVRGVQALGEPDRDPQDPRYGAREAP